MTVWLLIVDTGSGPVPFGLFWAEWACALVRDGLSGARAVCVARVPGVAI